MKSFVLNFRGWRPRSLFILSQNFTKTRLFYKREQQTSNRLYRRVKLFLNSKILENALPGRESNLSLSLSPSERFPCLITSRKVMGKNGNDQKIKGRRKIVSLTPPNANVNNAFLISWCLLFFS